MSGSYILDGETASQGILWMLGGFPPNDGYLGSPLRSHYLHKRVKNRKEKTSSLILRQRGVAFVSSQSSMTSWVLMKYRIVVVYKKIPRIPPSMRFFSGTAALFPFPC
jgi:hypothetical protein